MSKNSSPQVKAWETRRRNQRDENWVRRELIKPEYENVGYNVKIEANDLQWVRAYATQGVAEAQKVLDRLEHPTVPPADLACIREGRSLAVEVKYFKDCEKRKYKFYQGLDEAAALLLQPYDQVVLWHVFDESFDPETIEKEVARHVARLVEDTIPIGYECSRIELGKLKSVFRIQAPLNPFIHPARGAQQV
jgi:hypothetical protein